ncbi:hypothetical protein PIB30_056689 [Stylosanthes scabra]|uniref:ADP-ribosyl cyclase/cyclic ADP-ribose hydrolase n=1 Tax=Stylosanthes scabra TaxID=79078 RepID=A0ABU6QK64_9FABA|nr:hypothetical protein [Stylosanthes scabra]
MADDGEASSSSLSEGMYDAFLSFRGEDTRYLFTDHLYYRLAEKEKLKVFRDEPDLKMGEEGIRDLLGHDNGSRIIITTENKNLFQDYSPVMNDGAKVETYCIHVGKTTLAILWGPATVCTVHNCTWALVGVDAGCVVEVCRWLMNFSEEPTGKLHHKFQQGSFDM